MLSSLHLWDYPQYRPVCYPIWRWNWNWKQDGFWQETSTVSESLSLPHPPKTNTASDISSGSRSNPTRHQRTLYVSCQKSCFFFPFWFQRLFYRNTMKPDYDLVRTHHPDSSHARLSSTHNAVEAHSRFRSIKAAYDFLRGRTLSPDPNSTPPPSPRNFDPYMHEMARRRRAYNASRDNFGKTEWTEGFGAPKQEREEWNDNGTKERLLLLFGVVVCVLISYCFLIDIEQKNISFSLKKYIGTGGRFIPQSSEDIHLYNLPYVGPSIVHIPILPLRVIRSTCLLPVVNISFRPIWPTTQCTIIVINVFIFSGSR